MIEFLLCVIIMILSYNLADKDDGHWIFIGYLFFGWVLFMSLSFIFYLYEDTDVIAIFYDGIFNSSD
jgi:hypothetical protein